MNKTDWFDTLMHSLRTLPYAEAVRVRDYYSELYYDRLEAGETESQIVDSFGDPMAAAGRVRDEIGAVVGDHKPPTIPVHPAVDEPVQLNQPVPATAATTTAPANTGIVAEVATKVATRARSLHPAVLVMLIIFASPFVIALAATIFGLAIALLATAFGLVVAIVATLFSLVVAGAALVLAGVVSGLVSLVLLGLAPAVAFVQIGISLVSIGVGIMMTVLGTRIVLISKHLFVWLRALMRSLFKLVRKTFAKEGK